MRKYYDREKHQSQIFLLLLFHRFTLFDPPPEYRKWFSEFHLYVCARLDDRVDQWEKKSGRESQGA
jgi:hypothetical protein